MKKIILVAVALLMVCIAKAQPAVGDFTYGVKVGLNTTYITNAHLKNKSSVHVGLFTEKRFSKAYGLAAELQYSRQGFGDRDNKAKERWSINYLNLPILFKIYIWQGLSIDFGPQFSYNVDGMHKWRENRDHDRDKIDGIKSFDFGIPAGISYAYKDFIVSARYVTGLLKTGSFDLSVFEENDRTQNRVFQLSVGYNFSNLFKK